MSTTPAPAVAHATFTIQRDFPVPPERAFAAFADPEAKAAWFVGGEGWETTETAHDFRVGGIEVNEGIFNGKVVSRAEARYTDIVENERIVLTYDMWVDGTHISTSVVSYEFEATDTGTRYTHTEHGVHLDGVDNGSLREEGTQGILDQLEAYLAGQSDQERSQDPRSATSSIS